LDKDFDGTREKGKQKSFTEGAGREK